MPTGNKFTERYEIADIKVLMTTYYDKVKVQAADYVAKTDWDESSADQVLDLGLDFYKKHKEKLNYEIEDAEVEYLLTGSLFNRFLIVHNGVMLHSSAVVVNGYAYLFSADSGTGKSTHTNLWLEHFGEDAYIINDDKPAIRYVDGEWFVYGTPWTGKTDTNRNTKVRLGAIVFLERSEDNWIEEEDTKDAVSKFFMQTIRKLNVEKNMDTELKTIEKLLREIPIYKMGCNISDEAVQVAYEKIRRV